MSTAIAVPGERLGSTDDFAAGLGTYMRGGFIYSKLAGTRKVEKKDNAVNGVEKPVISVELEAKKHLVPEIGRSI